MNGQPIARGELAPPNDGGAPGITAIDRASPPSGPTAFQGADADWPSAAAIENKPVRRYETHLRGKQIRKNLYARFVTKSSAKIEKISKNNEKRLTGCRSTSKYHRGIFAALSIRSQRHFKDCFICGAAYHFSGDTRSLFPAAFVAR